MLDVREAVQFNICSLPGSVNVPLAALQKMAPPTVSSLLSSLTSYGSEVPVERAVDAARPPGTVCTPRSRPYRRMHALVFLGRVIVSHGRLWVIGCCFLQLWSYVDEAWTHWWRWRYVRCLTSWRGLCQ